MLELGITLGVIAIFATIVVAAATVPILTLIAIGYWMVAADYLLLTKGLKVDHLRLAMGTSMGCMHSFVWGETYPDFVDALMPLACLPTQIAGRNRIWRKMIIDAIRDDPAWQGGEYKEEPKMALRKSA